MPGFFYAGSSYASQGPIFASLLDTRPDCGGVPSTATAGQRYASGHLHCGPLPPIPPTPPPSPSGGAVGGIGARGRKPGRLRRPRPFDPRGLYRDEGRRTDAEELFGKRSIEALDEEDIVLILALWMSIKD